MPEVSWDRQKERYVINWRFPKPLHGLTGEWFRHRFPKDTTPTQARDGQAEKWIEYTGIIEAARQHFSTPEGVHDALRRIRERLAEIRTKQFPLVTAALAAMDEHNAELEAETARLRDQTALVRLATRLGASVDISTEPKVYAFQTCIDKLWVPKRRRAGKPVDEKTVDRLVGTKVRRLTAHLGHDDMSRVTRDDLETYFDQTFTGKAVATVRDHIIMIQSLFAVAHDRTRITENPAKRLSYSKDNDNPGRPFLPSERNAIIRAARACDDETVRWLWLLACYYGPRIAEFAEARLRDVVEEDGVPIIFLDKLHRTGREKTLKTPESRRWLPLHSAMREQFMARVARLRQRHGDDGPLFPDLAVYDGRRNKAASLRVNAWLDRLVESGGITIIDADNKSYHSLRHTVSTMLKGCKWADFITGHAATGVKAKVYEHPPLDEVVADVETLEWPLVAGAG